MYLCNVLHLCNKSIHDAWNIHIPIQKVAQEVLVDLRNKRPYIFIYVYIWYLLI